MILKAENIQKTYDDLSILKGIDLEINQNEIVSIIGASVLKNYTTTNTWNTG